MGYATMPAHRATREVLVLGDVPLVATPSASGFDWSALSKALTGVVGAGADIYGAQLQAKTAKSIASTDAKTAAAQTAAAIAAAQQADSARAALERDKASADHELMMRVVTIGGIAIGGVAALWIGAKLLRRKGRR